MTYPPQGSDGSARDDSAASPPAYGQQAPQYGAPPYGQPPPYGPPQPYAHPPAYGQAPAYGTPQYGPPQYAPYGMPGQPFGPPPGGPQKKSKAGLIALLTGAALLVITGAVVVIMTLRSTVLDAASAERDVAAQFEQREGVSVDLHCPSGMEVTAGATYTCTGRTADGESVTLTLTITDATTAAYTWSER